MIVFDNLTKTYRGIKAVDNLSLQIPRGSIFGFIGPNGAGKTTTIKMMTGVLRPTSGSIRIDGFDIAREPSTEFLRFKGGLYGMDRIRLNEEISHLLNTFELTEWGDELIESYSHGMKQRLIIASALIHRPKVIVVDEPMVALDPRGAKLVKDLFKDKASKGVTVFMSTHALALAQEVCQHIAIVDRGRIVASGTPKDLEKQAGVKGDLESIFLALTAGTTKA